MRFIIDDEVVLSRPLEGPLASQITAFAKWVREQGYAWHPRYRRQSHNLIHRVFK
jgi:hypothetical protein